MRCVGGTVSALVRIRSSSSVSSRMHAPSMAATGERPREIERRCCLDRSSRQAHVAPRPIGARFAMLGWRCGGRMDLLPDINGRA